VRYVERAHLRKGSNLVKLSLYISTGTTQEFCGHTDPGAAFAKVADRAGAAAESAFDTIWAPDQSMPFGLPDHNQAIQRLLGRLPDYP
jgi:hypothetical protein